MLCTCILACWSGAIYPTVYSFFFYFSWIWVLLNFSLVLWVYSTPFHIELVTPNTVHLLKCVQSSIIAADTLMLEKIEGKKRKGQQRMRWLDNIINSMDMNLRILREIVKGREAWHATVHGVTKSHTRLNDWTATTSTLHYHWQFAWVTPTRLGAPLCFSYSHFCL